MTSPSSPGCVNAWFTHNILGPRLQGSRGRGIIIQLFVTSVLYVLTSTEFLRPWTAFTAARQLFSLSKFGQFFILASCLYCLSYYVIAPNLRLETKVNASKAAAVFKIVTSKSPDAFQNAMKSLGVSLLYGFISTKIYLHLFAPIWLAKSVHVVNGIPMVNETHLFLVISGAFAGFLLWNSTMNGNETLLMWPQICQRGTLRLKQKFPEFVRVSVVKALSLEFVYFLLFYATFAAKISNFASKFLRAESEIKHADILTFSWTLVTAFFYSTFFNALLIFTFKLFFEVHSITLTKPVTEFESENGIIEAFRFIGGKDSKSDLLKYSALQEFSTLSNSEVRKELFKLSLPGGHPRNWHAIRDVCLSEIEAFSRALVESQQSASSGGSSSSSAFIKNNNNMIKGQKYSNDGGLNGGGPDVLRKISLILRKIRDRLTQGPSNSELAVREVFARSQIIIWVVEGLSNVVAASLFEDEFGVIQRDLANLLTALLNLQKVVERHQGFLSSANVKGFTTDEARRNNADIILKKELRSAIKTSIYRITSSFGENIFEVQIEEEFRQKLDNYVNYLE